MRVLKFRQAIYSKDKFNNWHYWGFLPDLSFVGPDSINGLAHALSNSQQFTGLLDKQGTEIYEGDIIEAYSETVNIGDGRKTGKWKRTRYTIEWKAPMFTKRRHENNYLNAFGIGSQELLIKYFGVIGNIHQNPELLKR